MKALGGYAHGDYAASLADYGTPHPLPRSGGWILERPIEGSTYRDAMGCYPLFACRDWTRVREDIEELRGELVSLVLVTDPFGDYTPDALRDCFQDLAVPFKEHYVTDLTRPPHAFVHPHHQRNARRASREVRVELCEDAAAFVGEWHELYANLISRHEIKGVATFSEQSFARQLEVPGAVLFRAVNSGSTVGMLWWYVGDDNVAYYHLGAYSEAGYRLRTSFALFRDAIEYFAARGVRWLSLGAGAGLGGDGEDGLSRFKRGWATGTRTAYLCGRVLDRERYEEIVKARNVQPTRYFPAYRLGEFV